MTVETDFEIKDFLNFCQRRVAHTNLFQINGRIVRVAGLVMETVGLQLPIGSPCHIPLPNGKRVEAEVVGFEGGRYF